MVIEQETSKQKQRMFFGVKKISLSNHFTINPTFIGVRIEKIVSSG